MDCVVTPLKTLMGFSVHLNVQLKYYNLPYLKSVKLSVQKDLKMTEELEKFCKYTEEYFGLVRDM